MKISGNTNTFDDLQRISSGSAVDANSAAASASQSAGGSREQRLSDQLTNQLNQKVSSIRQQIKSPSQDQNNSSDVGSMVDIYA